MTSPPFKTGLKSFQTTPSHTDTPLPSVLKPSHPSTRFDGSQEGPLLPSLCSALSTHLEAPTRYKGVSRVLWGRLPLLSHSAPVPEEFLTPRLPPDNETLETSCWKMAVGVCKWAGVGGATRAVAKRPQSLDFAQKGGYRGMLGKWGELWPEEAQFRVHREPAS